MIGNRPEWDAGAAQRKSKASKLAALAVLAVLALSGCTSYESAYERAVYDDEPVYCYQSLGGVDCYRTPNRRDDTRLVNYYGPAPSRTPPPKQPKAVAPQPPPAGEGAVQARPLPAAGGVVVAQNEGQSGQPAAGSPAPAASKFAWREWLPLLTVTFGGLQVLAAFVL